MYQSGGTVSSLLNKVADQEYLLPAIQREFVWKPEQICTLFDSLLQGYPFGTFLFWKIKPANRQKYQFYQFMTHYHERDNHHCENVTQLPDSEFTAVLDGQQRITALNIGLRGSYARKLSGKWWKNDDAFPVRQLYLNLFSKLDPDTGSVYQFEFLTEERAIQRTNSEFWFRVCRVLEDDEDLLIDEVTDDESLAREQRDVARSNLRHLVRTVHHKPMIFYYEESEQDLERVLNIFIRMNSGGTVLSYSDLLLSIAVAQWTNLDAREEIHSLVDELNNIGDGFQISKDLVLKTGLMLSDIGSVGFKVENFNKTNMAKLEEQWDSIREALTLSVQLIAGFGFNGQNLRATSVILPIAYYLHHRSLDSGYLTRSAFAKDRDSIRSWILRSLLKASGIWGSGLDTLLTAIRVDIKNYGNNSFPAAQIESTMAQRGKSLRFDDEEIDELVQLEYGNPRAFSLLSLLFCGFDFSRHFHVDHIYPKGLFSSKKLSSINIPEERHKLYQDHVNRLPNLQLMEGSVNNEKRQKMPNDWYIQQWPDESARKAHLQSQAISWLPDSISEFLDFYEDREKLLKARIRSVVTPASKVV
ncbi:DUF262 domain-containing protein [Idiomarina sp.]|uniref:DUF262 domain-containing protein n=1 Tax=Idiomarina sp. TaxID=1874361 RepID=UPI003A93F76B